MVNGIRETFVDGRCGFWSGAEPQLDRDLERKAADSWPVTAQDSLDTFGVIAMVTRPLLGRLTIKREARSRLTDGLL